MSNPYLIEGPAIIAVSFGKSSGYMFRHILDAHGGSLPPDVYAVFTNTGKEREEALRFGHEMGTHWHPIIWVEWSDNDAGFEIVSHNSASRLGEPFEALIRAKGYVPNRGAPYCSIELKQRVSAAFARSLGWKNWSSVVGFRHDEGARILGAAARNVQKKDPWRTICPLDRAKVLICLEKIGPILKRARLGMRIGEMYGTSAIYAGADYREAA